MPPRATDLPSIRSVVARNIWRAAAALLLLSSLIMAPARSHAQQSAPITPSTPWFQPKPDQRLARIAFGSCLDQRLAQPIWKPIIAAKPDLFLMLGDNVYGDVSDAKLHELKFAYAVQAAHPELAAARAAMPFLATWDDHDYGLNDASADFPHKVASRALFAGFWGLAQPSLPPDAIYRSHVFGPPGERVQVILLDLRSARSPFQKKSAPERVLSQLPGPFKPDPDPTKTMLGLAQWTWFAEQLKQPAEIRIVASSIQLLANDTGWERWGHLSAERQRFLQLLKNSGAKGVIVISGDRHRSAIYRHTESLAYPLFDVTSSALNRTRAGAEPEDAGRLTPMLAEDNFGLIDIDWTARKLRLSLTPLSGRDWPSVTIPFSDLGHGN